MTTPPWVPHVTGLPDKNRVLASDYLEARGDAWERGRFDDGRPMDPVITDFRHEDEADNPISVMLWLAFMAGSDWERAHRGRRYIDETTSTT